MTLRLTENSQVICLKLPHTHHIYSFTKERKDGKKNKKDNPEKQEDGECGEKTLMWDIQWVLLNYPSIEPPSSLRKSSLTRDGEGR